MKKLLLLALLIVFSCQPTVKKKLTLNSLFSDHMVLQQKENVMIWGKYTPKGKISVKADWGSESSVKADEKGNWKLDLITPESGGPFEVSIFTKDSTITLVDVMVGEVWLASGQSNMEMSLEGYLPNEPINNNLEEIAAADYPDIRSYNVERAISHIPLNESKGQWKVTSPENANKFSATAYFFARKLHQELNIPIGIINSTWGGTPVESWMSREKIKQLGEFEKQLNALESIDTVGIKTYFSNFSTVSLPSDTSNVNAWNALALEDGAFSQTDFDDSSWSKVNLSGHLEGLDMAIEDDGAFWFRKQVAIADVSSDYKFIVDEGIDDMDVVYVNGQKIGSTLGWNSPREYVIPKSILVEGENTIAIRVIDTGYGGGFRGQMILSSNSGEKISIDGEWSYQYTAGLSNLYGNQKFYLYHLNPEALVKKPTGFSRYNSLFSFDFPGVLYNGMINPLIPFNIKGAIWYQGESNVGRANQYEKIFPGMIEDWRIRWKSNFPFYFVQIAPFSYKNELSPALRDAQRKSLATPNTGMAVTMDIGDSISIHPGNKQDVGDRLARLALFNDYGSDIVPSGPLYKSHKISGNKIILEFELFGNKLMVGKLGLSGFEIASFDKVYVPASAKILGDKIEVFAADVLEPKYVRYAWRDNIVGTLFNTEGLPASSFTTEE
jgi:sialate O-acetylesterase